MAETLKRSIIGSLATGQRVNLERAARVDSRLDGHIVQGHVDGTGTLLSRTPGDGWQAVRFGMPAELARYVAEKGSIAVDGVSLTVTAVGAGLVRGGPHPGDPARHRARREVGGRSGQPRGGRARQVHRTAARLPNAERR